MRACEDLAIWRYCSRCPFRMARDPIALPLPVHEVRCCPFGWSIDEPPVLVDQLGHLVREVLVVCLEGPDAQEGPHDLVGLGPAGFTSLSEEQEVQLALLVQLEGHEDLQPLVEGPHVKTSLDEGPLCSEAILDVHEVPPFVVVEEVMIDGPEEPEGPKIWPSLLPIACAPSRASLSTSVRRRGLIPPIRARRLWRRWRWRRRGPPRVARGSKVIRHGSRQ